MRDGDLWKKFQEAARCKCPWSVWLTKIKRHATTEQVDKGEVNPEDKAGNDVSDEAAGKGSKDEQKNLAPVAEMYTIRNTSYQKFIRRVL